MKAIWKYELTMGTRQVVEMPVGAKLLTVHRQEGIVCLWAIVNTALPTEERIIGVFTTGYPLPENPKEYIGTAFFNGGEFVVHVFEILTTKP